MRKISTLLILLAISGISFKTLNIPSAQVKNVAIEQLQKSLALIPVGNEEGFGFASRDEFSSATTGEVYRTISLTTEFYNDAKLGAKDYILLQNEWRVPVVVNNENRLLLTVFGNDSSLNVVDIGAVGLSKELQSNSFGQTANEKYILRIYPLACDFVAFVEAGKTLAEGNYYPMNSALTSMPSLNGKVMTQAQVLEQVKIKLASPSKN